MLNSERALLSTEDREHEDEYIRDIHPLTPPSSVRPQRSSSLSMASNDGSSTENFTTMSREFNALVLAGSAIGSNGNENDGVSSGINLGRIREDEMMEEETNPLAIVPDNNPLEPPPPVSSSSSSVSRLGGSSTITTNEVSVQRVKKEEIEAKINAWQTAKISKINSRFKREDAIISGCENEQIQKASSWMKKVERKLEEKRARALEKMQNDVAKARRKAEERRASAEARRGTKVAQILELVNLMRAVGRAPVKRSFF